MKRSRAVSRAMWQAVADGEHTHDVVQWLPRVAAAIVAADNEKNDNDRRAAVLQAVGLFGRFDPERDIIRAIVLDVDHTCSLIEKGSRWAPARPLRRGEKGQRRRDAVAQALDLVEAPAVLLLT